MSHHRLLVLACIFLLTGEIALAQNAPKIERIRVPRSFVLNDGQWDARVKAASMGYGPTVSFSNSGYSVAVIPGEGSEKHEAPGSKFSSMEMVGVRKDIRPMQSGAVVAPLRLIDGSAAPARESLLPATSSLTYADAWKGIDVRMEGDAGELRHEIHVAAGSDPSQVRLRFDNVPLGALHVECSDAAVKPLIRQSSAGATEITLGGGYVRPYAFTVTVGFTLFYGGTREESDTFVRVDRDGYTRLSGTTNSFDFPTLPAKPFPPLLQTMMFDVKLSADGRTVKHSTVIFNISLVDAAIGIQNRHVLLVGGTNLGPLLTFDAKHTTFSSYGVIVLSDAGEIVYISYILTDGLQEIADMECGPDGDVYMIAHTYSTPPMVTADAMFKKNQGAEDGFIMRFSGCDYSLIYASCFGGKGHEEYTHIALSDSNEIAILGIMIDRGTYPVVNAVQSASNGDSDYIITKFEPDFRSIVFSTFLGGKVSEIRGQSNVRRLRFDASGRVYFAGETPCQDFPLFRSMKGSVEGTTDIVLVCFSPTGQLIFSSFFGGMGSESVNELTVDACGNMILTGFSNSADLPIVSPIAGRVTTVPTQEAFIAVVNPHTATIPFCSWYGGVTPYSLTLHNNSVLISSATTGDNMQASAGMPGPNPSGRDIVLSRLDIPGLCPRVALPPLSRGGPMLSVNIDIVSSVRVDTFRRVATPTNFVLRATISNLDSHLTSDSLLVRLAIPLAIKLRAGSIPLELVVPGLPPQGKRLLEWLLHSPYDSLRNVGSLRFIVSALPIDVCPTSSSQMKTIPVIHEDFSYKEVHCVLESFPQPEVDIQGMRLVHDTLHVRVRVHNVGTSIAPIKAIRLHDPHAATLRLLSPSLLRPIAAIPPKSDVEAEFLFRVLSLQINRAITLTAALIDTFDYETEHCEISVTIPGVTGTICSTTSPPEVKWYQVARSSDPYPIPIALTIENPSDTMRFYTVDRLDFSRAPHLKLDVGEIEQRPRFFVADRYRRKQNWNLAVIPPIDEDVSETVGIVYITEFDGKEHVCDAVVNICVERNEIVCDLLLPDSLHLDTITGLISPSEFTATAVFHNVGIAALPLKEADILLPPDGMITLLDARLKGLHQLAAGERDTVSWSLHAMSSPTERLSSISVVAYAPDASEAARCEKTIFIPAVGIPCLVISPDTVHYDVLRGEYETDEFDVTLRLRNPTDTALVNVQVRLDTASLIRSRLVGPAMPVRVIALLDAGASVDVTWKLTPLWAATDEEEHYVVFIDIGERGIHSTCDATTLIEGGPRDVSLHCSTAGHDTIWADNFYEALIPDPLQLQYTVRNTGTMISKPCRIAIVLPPVLVLAAGEDSVKMISAILPGVSASAEWMLDIVQSQVAVGSVAVRWIADCDGQETPLSCEATVTITARDPNGIVLTPWLLRFTAERLGALPASKSVTLWTGGGPTPAWAVAQAPSWLSTIPLDGNARTVMSVQPVTTDLPIGEHRGLIEIHPTPITPGDIQVVYAIIAPLSVSEPRPVETVALYDSHPNPVVRGERTTLPYRVPVGSVSRISVRDVLGREILSRTEAASVDGQGSIVIDTDRLRSGVYYISLRTSSGEATRSIVVLP